MSSKSKKQVLNARRQFTDDFKRETVQMLLDGHSASSVVERLELAPSKRSPTSKRPKGNQKTHKFLIRLLPKTITVATPIVCSAPF